MEKKKILINYKNRSERRAPVLTPVKVVIPILVIYKLVSIRFNHSSIIMRPFSQTNMEMHVHV